MGLPDTEKLFTILVSPTLERKEEEKRSKLIALIEDYFGEEDAQLVLAIAVYFKSPYRYGYLLEEIQRNLEGEL